MERADSQQECMTKQALEQVCLAKSGWQLTQAIQTLCFTTPLLEIFGECGVHRQAFDEVLDGKFIPPNECDQYVRKVLYHLQKPPKVSDIGLPTIMDYINGWQHTQEETSSLIFHCPFWSLHGWDSR